MEAMTLTQCTCRTEHASRRVNRETVLVATHCADADKTTRTVVMNFVGGLSIVSAPPISSRKIKRVGSGTGMRLV